MACYFPATRGLRSTSKMFAHATHPARACVRTGPERQHNEVTGMDGPAHGPHLADAVGNPARLFTSQSFLANGR
jgi:hypothetical protein